MYGSGQRLRTTLAKKFRVMKSETPGERNSAFSNEINRIDYLGISESNSAYAAGLKAEMHSLKRAEANNSAVTAKLTGKVDIFQPAVKWQALIKSQITDVGEPQSHVAPIGRELFNFYGLL